MPRAQNRFIRRWAEFEDQNQIDLLPRGLRGIYVLYKHVGNGRARYDVLYVGMARAGRRGGIRGRLNAHLGKKGHLWTHFSVFDFWDNITDEEIADFEAFSATFTGGIVTRTN